MKVQFQIISITVLIILIAACSQDEANLETVDSLITIGKYEQAGKILHNFEMKSYSDTVQVKRIKARIRTLERKRFFKTPDKFIDVKMWDKADKSLDSLQRRINLLEKHRKQPYLFDYFYRKSIIDSALGKAEKSVQDMEQAVKHYTGEHEKLWRLYEKLAVYYAEQGEFVKARENLDKALRKTDLNNIKPELRRVFSLYMNGSFLKARDSLEVIPDSLKDKHWKTAQKFFEKYADKLTMEDRFRLW